MHSRSESSETDGDAQRGDRRGTNLIVADAGFDGIVLRFEAARIWGTTCCCMPKRGSFAGRSDLSVSLGLHGMQTMTGIPGYVAVRSTEMRGRMASQSGRVESVLAARLASA